LVPSACLVFGRPVHPSVVLRCAMAAMTPQKLNIRKPVAGTPAPKFSDDLRVAWVPGAKPAGSISGDRYALYCVGRTVGEAKKLGAKQADVKWDWDKGYMQLTDQQGVPLGGYAPAPRAEEVAVPRPQKQKVERPPAMTTPQKRAAPKPAAAEKTPAVAKPQPEVARKVVVEPPPPAKRVRTLALPRILARAEKLRAMGLLPSLAATPPAAVQVEEPTEQQLEKAAEAPERTEEQQAEEAPMQVEETIEEQEVPEEEAEQQPEAPMQVDEQCEEQQEVQQADGETAAAQEDQEEEETAAAQEDQEEETAAAQVDQEEEQQGQEPAPVAEPAEAASEEQQQEAEPTTES